MMPRWSLSVRRQLKLADAFHTCQSVRGGSRIGDSALMVSSEEPLNTKSLADVSAQTGPWRRYRAVLHASHAWWPTSVPMQRSWCGRPVTAS